MPISRRMTAEEFYRWPGAEGVRYELVDGLPVAMGRANRRHDSILVNALAVLVQSLRGSSLYPFTKNAGIRCASGNVLKADFGVDGGPVIDTAFEASAPRLVLEVLSPSTRSTDLVRKLEEYKALPSLSYILLAEQDLPRVLMWWRAPGNLWELAQFDGLDGVVGLPEIGTELAMVELYDGVRFPDPLAGEGPLG